MTDKRRQRNEGLQAISVPEATRAVHWSVAVLPKKPIADVRKIASRSGDLASVTTDRPTCLIHTINVNTVEDEHVNDRLVTVLRREVNRTSTKLHRQQHNSDVSGLSARTAASGADTGDK